MKTKDYRHSFETYISEPIVFPFGYYHDSPVLWRVLASTENEVLVISDRSIELDGIIADTFNPPLLTYSSEWLNQTFLYSAFSLSEQQLILDTEVSYSNGLVENNKIWMLSENEAEELFISNYERRAYATEYVKSLCEYAKGAPFAWGLRNDSSSAFNDEYFYVSEKGYTYSDDDFWLWFIGVRPAMWIKKDCVPKEIRPSIKTRCIFYTQKTIQLGRYRGCDLFWTELDSDDEKHLLLCNNIIEYLPFHNVYKAVAWDTCSLRAWMNQEFYYTAFNDIERQLIKKAILQTKNSQDTTDHVWLLSANEAKRYFPDSRYNENTKLRLYGPCAYLEPKNIGKYIGIKQQDVWLLRSNARCEQNTSEVSNVIDYNSTTHKVNDEGRNLNVNCIAGIRPSVWI